MLIEAIGDRVHISIHALREEGDALQNTITEIANIFLSTPSARRATSTSSGTISAT